MFRCFFQNTWQDKEEQTEEYINLPEARSIIPYNQIHDDNITILSKNLSFSRIVILEGFDNIAVSTSVIEKLSNERLNFFNKIPDEFYITLFTFKKNSDRKSVV